MLGTNISQRSSRREYRWKTESPLQHPTVPARPLGPVLGLVLLWPLPLRAISVRHKERCLSGPTAADTSSLPHLTQMEVGLIGGDNIRTSISLCASCSLLVFNLTAQLSEHNRWTPRGDCSVLDTTSLPFLLQGHFLHPIFHFRSRCAAQSVSKGFPAHSPAGSPSSSNRVAMVTAVLPLGSTRGQSFCGGQAD